MIYSTLFKHLMVTLGRWLLLVRRRLLRITEKTRDWIFIVISSICLTHIFYFMSILHIWQQSGSSDTLWRSVWYGPSNVWQDGMEKYLVIILAGGKRVLFVDSQLDESGDLTSHAHTRTHSKHLQGSSLSVSAAKQTSRKRLHHS